ncbi:hypothetical protein LX36DRAFT_320634 [Colletotrichum falcatum]|nr:hypothetical protein LX36DRAFT_320634 [Colletotrichum falcatum]
MCKCSSALWARCRLAVAPPPPPPRNSSVPFRNATAAAAPLNLQSLPKNSPPRAAATSMCACVCVCMSPALGSVAPDMGTAIWRTRRNAHDQSIGTRSERGERRGRGGGGGAEITSPANPALALDSHFATPVASIRDATPVWPVHVPDVRLRRRPSWGRGARLRLAIRFWCCGLQGLSLFSFFYFIFVFGSAEAAPSPPWESRGGASAQLFEGSRTGKSKQVAVSSSLLSVSSSRPSSRHLALSSAPSAPSGGVTLDPFRRAWRGTSQSRPPPLRNDPSRATLSGGLSGSGREKRAASWGGRRTRQGPRAFVAPLCKSTADRNGLGPSFRTTPAVFQNKPWGFGERTDGISRKCLVGPVAWATSSLSTPNEASQECAFRQANKRSSSPPRTGILVAGPGFLCAKARATLLSSACAASPKEQCLV